MKSEDLFDPVLLDDTIKEVSGELETWALLREADELGRLAAEYESRARTSKKNRDKQAPDRAQLKDLAPLNTKLWYKFHGQCQAYTTAAREARKAEAIARSKTL